jgi:hypothetical protein
MPISKKFQLESYKDFTLRIRSNSKHIFQFFHFTANPPTQVLDFSKTIRELCISPDATFLLLGPGETDFGEDSENVSLSVELFFLNIC